MRADERSLAHGAARFSAGLGKVPWWLRGFWLFRLDFLARFASLVFSGRSAALRGGLRRKED
jgi:hypothetical protein